MSEPADKNVCATERDKTKENEYKITISENLFEKCYKTKFAQRIRPAVF